MPEHTTCASCGIDSEGTSVVSADIFNERFIHAGLLPGARSRRVPQNVCTVCARAAGLSYCYTCRELYVTSAGCQSEHCQRMYREACSECGDSVDNRIAQGECRHDNAGRIYCLSCADDHLVTCCDCGREIHSDDEYDDNGDTLCESCSNARNRCIESYHSQDKASTMHGDGPLYFGFELEIEGGERDWSDMNRDAKHVREMMPADSLLYFETDSSLDNGFEIISAPMSPEFYQATAMRDIRRMLAYLRGQGYTSHDQGTCGLHVHISRDSLGCCESEREYTLTKMMLIVERFWSEVLRLSRRTERSAGNYAARYGSDDVTQIDYAVKHRQSARMSAVNIQNSGTVELRIMRGTLRAQTFEASIAFALTLAEVARKASVDDIHNATSLRGVLTSAGVVVPGALLSYMNERGL